MALEDFERQLEADRLKTKSRKRSRSRSRERHHRHSKYVSRTDSQKHHHGHHSSSRSAVDTQAHERKRTRRNERHIDHSKKQQLDRHDRQQDLSDDALNDRRRDKGALIEEEDSEWEEKEAYAPPPDDEDLDDLLEAAAEKGLKRDDWMQAPGMIDVDYVNRKRTETKAVTTGSLEEELSLKMHQNELNHLLKDLQGDIKTAKEDFSEKQAQREVDYTFGDQGSAWRMTRLRGVLRKAKETGQTVEQVALERYADLREFDDAREEEVELDRRAMYGREYVGKIKPSGELYEERLLQSGLRRGPTHAIKQTPNINQGQRVQETATPLQTSALDQTALNRLKARVMKAKLKGGPEYEKLEAEYQVAMTSAANTRQPDTVVLDAVENRMLVGGRKGEVNSIDNKRGRERGLVEENEDMSIEDMVRQERRTRGRTEGAAFAERIARDAKFDNDLDYLDENATKLSKHVQKTDMNLRNMAISDFQKMSKILASCPLCHHEDKDEPPIAPVASLATRVYLTLPTEPEITSGGAVIVPVQHHFNLLECDDDEWEEIRNFMKCLTRMYHDQGRAVIFYENAANLQRKGHAAMVVVPLPYALGETAPAFFKEAILSADEEWSQHKKVIDTLKAARDGGMGRSAFRKSLAKEMPYFHVWFDLDGGLGHIVEDERRWPRGDLFAREVIGGMVDAAPDLIKRQGKWHRTDPRLEGFRKKWRKFDWTRVLLDAEQ